MQFTKSLVVCTLMLAMSSCQLNGENANDTLDGATNDVEIPNDSDVLDDLINTADVTPDKADAVKLERRCVENWPVDPKATPLPSLPITAPQVLWTKEVPGIEFVGSLAMAGDRLAYATTDYLVLLDRQGNLVETVSGYGPWTNAEYGPLADPEGNFYVNKTYFGLDGMNFGEAALMSVTPDGVLRWSHASGDVSPVLLSPAGVLYFAAGNIYAVSGSDGESLWDRSIGAQYEGPFSVGVGIGDSVFTESANCQAVTGEFSTLPQIDGKDYAIALASYSSLLGFNWNADDYWWQVHVFDRCGELKWSFPTDNSLYVHLVGFEDTMVTTYGEQAVIYSADGEMVQGPAPLDIHYLPQVIGADGTIYYRHCTELGRDVGEGTIQAYSPTLELLWSVDVGTPCSDAAPVLADDGVLYLLHFEHLSGATPRQLKLTAIQTASPGLANTAYPTFRANNRRTGWIGGGL